MRASVEKNDPGYRPDAFNLEVYLDGKRLEACVTADEELGIAVVFAKQDGDFILNEDCTEIVRKTLSGKVEIREKCES